LAITAAHLWIKRRWQLSWRAFLTDAFLTHWLERGYYHRLRHLPEHADNPDARIAEDIRIASLAESGKNRKRSRWPKGSASRGGALPTSLAGSPAPGLARRGGILVWLPS